MVVSDSVQVRAIRVLILRRFPSIRLIIPSGDYPRFLLNSRGSKRLARARGTVTHDVIPISDLKDQK